MIFFTATAFWGWVSLTLLGFVVAIPYLRRKVVPSTGLPNAAPRPYLAALPLHYCLAPAVLIISFFHAWIPMASGHMPHTSMRGLWLATYALGLIFVQLLLGLAASRRPARRTSPAPHSLRPDDRNCRFGLIALMAQRPIFLEATKRGTAGRSFSSYRKAGLLIPQCNHRIHPRSSTRWYPCRQKRHHQQRHQRQPQQQRVAGTHLEQQRF